MFDEPMMENRLYRDIVVVVDVGVVVGIAMVVSVVLY